MLRANGADPLIDFPTQQQSIAWKRLHRNGRYFNLPRHGECLGSFSIVGHADDSCFPPGCGAPDVPRRSLPDHTTFEGRHLGVASFLHPPFSHGQLNLSPLLSTVFPFSKFRPIQISSFPPPLRLRSVEKKKRWRCMIGPPPRVITCSFFSSFPYPVVSSPTLRHTGPAIRNV